MASFGEELKRERELRDISLKEISEATKISIRFLEALEQNNFDILPGGIFNRGFIRAYARFIGIDGEEMVNAYLAEVAQHESASPQPAQGSQPQTDGSGKTPQLSSRVYRPGAQAGRAEPRPEATKTDRIAESRAARTAPDASGRRTTAALWLLLVASVLVGAVVIAMSMVGRRSASATASGRGNGAQDAPLRPGGTSGRTSGPGIEARDGGSPAHAALEPSPSGPLTTPQEELNPTGSSAQGGAGAGPSSQSEPPAPDASGPQGIASSSTEVPDPNRPAADAGPAPPPIRSVRVQAIETTRVQIECAGLVAVDQELWPGQSRTIDCSEPVLISAHNAGAVVYSIDGAPAALLGRMGERIEGLQVSPPPAPPTPPAPRRAPPAGIPEPQATPDAGN